MKLLAWASDIHLDHAGEEEGRAFMTKVRDCGADMVLLGGDMSTAPRLKKDLFDLSQIVFKPIFFVLGNHDYYHGDIAGIRKRQAKLENPGCQWLAAAGPQEVLPGVTLVGHGGWGDARYGDFAGSAVVLTDYLKIKELKAFFNPREWNGTFGPDTPLEKELNKLGHEAADSLAPQLEAAVQGSQQVIVLTHVPPFVEACWHEGQISAPDWQPGFTCGATGEVIRAAATAHPGVQFTVLCGHTHGGGITHLADNLVVHTQAAQYGQPDFQLLEVSENSVAIVE